MSVNVKCRQFASQLPLPTPRSALQFPAELSGLRAHQSSQEARQAGLLLTPLNIGSAALNWAPVSATL